MRKFSKKTKWIMVGTVLYLFMPQDIIPDYILGFGQLDDAAVLGLLVKSILNDRKKKD